MFTAPSPLSSLLGLLLWFAIAVASRGEEANIHSGGITLHRGVEEMPGLKMGPFVRLGNGNLLTVEQSGALISGDEGETWQARPMFPNGEAQGGKQYSISNERAVYRTREGQIIVAFMNLAEKRWTWSEALGDAPGARLPTYVVRSTDDGQTWETPQKLHDEWTGAIRNMIETRDGAIVFTSMMMRHNPGRHAVLTYRSVDGGQTWRPSNVIDLGGAGHHDGALEPVIVQRNDGKLWMLIRTNWLTFWTAESNDDGKSWHPHGPSGIAASSAPAMITRLQSGRLMLLWNRPYAEGKSSHPLVGGDRQWSAVPVSNHRAELSLAFSGDDGKTWTAPVVIARKRGSWISYPYVFEAKPGEIWVTTMQGGLRVKLREQDFVENE